MTNEMAVRQQEIAVASAPMTVEAIKAQVNTIQSVMKAVMHDGQHYGVIPGCGDKPSLLKPGAEKILMTFRLRAIINTGDIEIVDMGNGHREYRVSCHIINYDGVELATGVGCASTMEKKWRYVRGAERTDIADQYNTVLKMAKKRAIVDGTLSATAASDIFTQDIEEMGAVAQGENKPKPSTPKPLSGDGPNKIKCVVSKCFEKKGKAPNSFGIKGPNGGRIDGFYQTRDENIISAMINHYEIGDTIELTYHIEKNGAYTNYVIDEVSAFVGPESGPDIGDASNVEDAGDL